MHHLSATVLRREMAARRISAEELTRLYLQRITSIGEKSGLNAVAEIDETALEQARKLDSRADLRELPLFGLPLLIKDNIDVAGLHTTAGSVALADNLATADAPIVTRLRANGAVILGKANMTEFANYMTDGLPGGFSSRGGQVIHAYDPRINPSGSSSGSAVAVAAGLCAAAIGTDTCFSIVGCATVNGVTGLKPAGGALSGEGIIPICYALDTAGPITRTFADAHLIYSAMRAQPLDTLMPTPVSQLRIAVNTFDHDQVSAEQLARYESLLDALRGAGAVIEAISQPSAPDCRRAVMRYAFKHDLEAYLRTSAAKNKTLAQIIAHYEAEPETRMPYGVTVLRMAQDVASGRMDEPAYLAALAERAQLRAQMLAQLKPYDACLMTGPTDAMHVANLPSVALRLCMADDHTPRGAIFYGADEARLHRAMAAIEQFCPGVTPPNP